MRVLSQKTKKDAEVVRANIFQENADYDVMARSGLASNLVAGIGNAFLDPTTLIPIGNTIKYMNVLIVKKCRTSL
jgi:hypothetical protein